MSYVETRTVVLPLKFKRQGENPSIQCAASARPFRCDGCVSLRFRLAVSPLPFCFPDHCWRETSTSGFLHFDLLVSPFSLPFSSIFQEASVSPCRGGLGLVVVRGLWRLRAMSVVHCPNLMRENANICMTRNGPLHSAHTKNTTNKVYGTTFIQAGEEFTTDDELCRKPCFFIFRAVRTMCFSTLSTAFALGKGSSLGLGNRPPGLTQEAKTFSTTSHNVATLQPLLWGFGDFGGPQPLARRVQAGVKNNRALPKTVR